MGYVESTLLSGERVVYKGITHWVIFVPGALLVVFAIYLFTLDSNGWFGKISGLIVLALGLRSLLIAFIEKLTTELAVTTKRVIAKFGLIRRTTMELNHSKVESFHVEQSILGRILGFGTIVVNGTGGGKTPVPNIYSPLEFRRTAMQVMDASQSVSMLLS